MIISAFMTSILISSAVAHVVDSDESSRGCERVLRLVTPEMEQETETQAPPPEVSDSQLYREIGERLVQLIERAGYSHSYVALQMEMSESALRVVLSGRTRAVSTFYKFARFFEVDPEVILGPFGERRIFRNSPSAAQVFRQMDFTFPDRVMGLVAPKIEGEDDLTKRIEFFVTYGRNVAEVMAEKGLSVGDLAAAMHSS